jgi:hypothetical protein
MNFRSMYFSPYLYNKTKIVVFYFYKRLAFIIIIIIIIISVLTKYINSISSNSLNDLSNEYNYTHFEMYF